MHCDFKRICFLTALFFSILFSTKGYAISEDANAPKLDSFALVSITKAGTHLVMDLLEKLTGLQTNPYGSLPLENSYNMYHCHMPYRTEKDLFKKNVVKKKIFIVRDLRDVLVSCSFWIENSSEEFVAPNDKTEFLKLSTRQEKLKWILNHKFDSYSSQPWGFNLTHQAEFIYKYKNRKDVLLIHFENLVGSRGGGDDELQFKEVKKIAQFINSPIKDNDQQLRGIASSLFGTKQKTFRKGQVGGWKEYFDRDLMTLFDKELKTYQKAFGYLENQS